MNSHHRLPLDLTDPEHAIESLACDTAGFYLADEGKPRYHKIFHYLDTRGYSEFREQDIREIKRLLQAQMAKVTSQTVFKIWRIEYPEIGKPKKALDAALLQLRTQSEIVCEDKEQRVLIRSSSVSDVCSQLAMIPFRALIDLVDEVYADSLNYVQLCRQVFERLSTQYAYQRQAYRHELIEAVISVLSERALFDAPPLAGLPGPIQSILQQELEKEMRVALKITGEPTLYEHHLKGRIIPNEIPLLLSAIERYLLDSINGGATRIPRYFNESMPPEAKSMYLTRYKYTFETSLKKTERDFHRRAMRNSTIRKLRNYW